MTTAPEDFEGAVRRSRRAALCLWAVAAAALVGVHAVPALEPFGRWAFELAFFTAGFAVMRELDRTPDGRGGLGAIGAMALWAIPALVVVGLAVLAATTALLPPADLKNQGWTALWTAVGASGVELMKQGPWRPHASADLLLHGWALGVVIQLALGWSLVALVVRRFGRDRWLAAIAMVGVVLTLLFDIQLRRQGFGIQAFYLAPPHGWTFLLGAWAARAWAGVQAPPTGFWPGLDAVARLGSISLPLVLWAWPLLALPRLILGRALTPLETAAAVGAAVILAVATHRWIERPLRAWLSSRPLPALAVTAAGLAGLAFVGGTVFALDGLPARASAEVRREEAAARVRPPLQAACQAEGRSLPPAASCTAPVGGRADIVLWGSSHADQLSPAVLAWAEGRGLGVRQATRSGCLPLLRAPRAMADADCLAFNRAAVAEWGRLRPRAVVIGGHWSAVLRRFPRQEDRALDILTAELADTVRAARAAAGPQIRIVLSGVSPDFDVAPSACHARRAFLDLDTARCDLRAPVRADLAARIDARLAAVAAAQPGVILYRPWPVFCADDGLCRTRGDDGPWVFDPLHLTAAGGRAQDRALAAALDAAVPN